MSPQTASYCVLHTGRCGSTVLGEVLNQHPSIRHSGEIFTPGVWVANTFREAPYFEKREAGDLTPDDFETFIETCKQAQEAGTFSVYGFELKLFQIGSLLQSTPESILDRLKAMNIMPVFLWRENALQRIVSAQRARQSGVWHIRAKTPRRSTTMTHIPVHKLIDRAHSPLVGRTLHDALRHDEAVTHQLRDLSARRSVATCTYEEINENLYATVAKITDPLNLPAPRDAEIPLRRTASPRISDEVENWDEVCDHLSGTRYAWMLTECERAT